MDTENVLDVIQITTPRRSKHKSHLRNRSTVTFKLPSTRIQCVDSSVSNDSIHSDLAMYRAMTDAFQMLSARYQRHKQTVQIQSQRIQ